MMATPPSPMMPPPGQGAVGEPMPSTPATDASLEAGGDPTMSNPDDQPVDPIEAMQRLREMQSMVSSLPAKAARARTTFNSSIKDEKMNRVIRLNMFFRQLKEMGYDISDPNDVTRLISDLETNQPGSSSVLSMYLDALDPNKTTRPTMTQDPQPLIQ